MAVTGSCHCGAVTIEAPSPPQWVASCNCSLCTRTAWLVAYYPDGAVKVGGETVPYIWGDRMIGIHHCPVCGCGTHWRTLGEDLGRMGPQRKAPRRIRFDRSGEDGKVIDRLMRNMPLCTLNSGVRSMRFQSFARQVLALVLVVLLPRAAAAQLVADPSFEAPVVHNVPPGYKYRPTAAGATFTGGAGITGNNDNAWGFQNAPDGVQVAFLQGTAGISQNVNGLAPGTVYAVKFWIAKRPSTGANEVTVSFNGLPIFKFKPTDNGWVAMTSRAFTAGSTAGTLTFSTNYSGPDDVTSGIDMVTIVPALAAVPDASFEAPGVGGIYVKNPTVPGLTFTGDAGIAGNGAGLAPAAPFGAQIGIMRNASGVPASIGLDLTNLTPGASYAVRYYAAVNPGQACALWLAFNGTTFSTVNYSNQRYEPFVSPIFIAPSTGTTGTLTFKNMTGDNSTCGIDMVAVVPVLAATVADPSFEVPDQGAGFTYAPDTAGISFSGSAGIAANGSAWGFAPAPDGHQVAFLQGGFARIAMNLSGLEPNAAGPFSGVLYAVQFQIAQRPGFGVNPVTVWIDGTPIGTYTPTSTNFTPVTSLWFTARKTVGTISFTGTSTTGDTGTAIDMVTVVPVPRIPQ